MKPEQKIDTTPASEVPPDVTHDHLYCVSRDGRKNIIGIRIKSIGYGATCDMASAPIADVLSAHGAKILYSGSALCDGFVGSLSGGSLDEICYLLGDKRWYLYVLTDVLIDTWGQDWWVSHNRLSAHAAADTIEQCRQRIQTGEEQQREVER